MRRREYNFYSFPILDALFKRLLKAWSSKFQPNGEDEAEFRDLFKDLTREPDARDR